MSSLPRSALVAAALAAAVIVPVTTTPVTGRAPAVAAATVQQVTIGTASHSLAGTNVQRSSNQMVVYTRTSTQTTSPANQWGAEAVITGGKVVSLVDRQVTGAAGTAIPVGSVVLSGHGTARDWLLANARPGTVVKGLEALGQDALAQPMVSWSASHRVAGTNIKRSTNQLVVYTRTSTQTVSPANQWGAEVTVSGGKIVSISDRQTTRAAATPIPSGAIVLSGHGTARDWLLRYSAPGVLVSTTSNAVTLSAGAAPTTSVEPAPTTSVEPAPAPSPTPTPVTTALVGDNFDGADATGYAASGLNGSHPTWFVESGSDPVNRLAGRGAKPGTTRFFRMWTQQAVGGPGQNIRIKAKVRTNSIYVRDAGGIVEGTKMWLKWADPNDEAYPGPASVRGIADSTSPGSYIYSFHTHNGYNEVSKRAPGTETSSAYTFFANVDRPYDLGTWEEVEMTYEWLPSGVRIRTYRNGTLQMEVTDSSATRMLIPGYAGIRSDDSTFDVDDFVVETF